MKWDLSDLYKGVEDPQIVADQEVLAKQTEEFVAKYKGRILDPQLTPDLLVEILQGYEQILIKLDNLGVYAGLMHSKFTGDSKIGKLYQSIDEFASKLSTQLIWVGLDWIAVESSKAQELLASPLLANYTHFLNHERVFKPHILNEREEQLLIQKSQTGGNAFVRLYDELDAGLTYSGKIEGEQKNLSYEELVLILRDHPDRAERQAASQILTAGLRPQAKTYGFILNNLLLDKKIDDEIRSYPSPMSSTLLGYEIKPETVAQVELIATKGQSVVEKFYQAKAELMGVDKLHEWDRYNLLYPEKQDKYTWEEAKQIVLESFQDFDPQMAEIAREFFDKNWIDAELLPGKRSGAFCSFVNPGKHPYIFMNFTGSSNDVRTLAHELGHGIHAYLAAKQNNYFQFNPSTATAEIASIFAEALVFDRLYKLTTDKEIRINMLMGKIQDTFATIFRQMAFHMFEQDVHQHRRDQGELSVEEFGEYFQSRLQDMFGIGLELTDQHRLWWMPILHFYHYDFYVFTYAFGETLTNALYGNYQRNAQGFVPGYVQALAAGGAQDPYALTKMMGVDIDDANFWEDGLKLIAGYVDEFVELVSTKE